MGEINDLQQQTEKMYFNHSGELLEWFSFVETLDDFFRKLHGEERGGEPMKKQPAMKIPKSSLAKFLDLLTVLIFIAVVIYLITQYSTLPDRVPGHYDEEGNVDRWGSKMELWILPLVGASLWVLMTIMERYPHTFTYLNLRQDNLEAQYRNGILMMNVLKNESVLLFSYLIFQGIRVATGASEGLGILFMPIFLAVIFGSIIIFMIRMLRL